jgi:hypothetical protein
MYIIIDCLDFSFFLINAVQVEKEKYIKNKSVGHATKAHTISVTFVKYVIDLFRMGSKIVSAQLNVDTPINKRPSVSNYLTGIVK